MWKKIWQCLFAHKRQGFCLLEVIVSIFFLSITISGFLTTYNYMNSRVEAMRWKRSALLIAQQKMEEFMADPNQLTSAYDIDIRLIPSTISMSIILDQNNKIVTCTINRQDEKDDPISLKTIVGN